MRTNAQTQETPVTAADRLLVASALAGVIAWVVLLALYL